jgi:hypothetical protein
MLGTVNAEGTPHWHKPWAQQDISPGIDFSAGVVTLLSAP